MPAPQPIAASNIAAQAFRYLEKSPISSFADDSEEASAATAQYPLALDMCLEAGDWSFASTLRDLSERAATVDMVTDEDLPHVYTPPADVLRLRDVGPEGTRWRLDADGLRADAEAPLRIRYTARVTNEAALPAAFQTAVALRLAALLAPRFLNTQSKVQALQDEARYQLKEALRQDARNASHLRYDGLADQGDWVTEARL